jgi:hypothetical protein
VISNTNSGPNSTNDSGRNPQSGDSGSDNERLSPAGSESEEHAPKPRGKCADANGKEKHWLEYATAAFAFVAAIGGILAAIFSGAQGWIARDTRNRQMRAYVLVDNKHIDVRNGNIGVQIRVKNFGATPARDIGHWVCVAIREFPLASTLPDYPFKSTLPSNTVLAPGGLTFEDSAAFCDEPESKARLLSPEKVAAIMVGSKAIYVYGFIRYRDAFSRVRWTTYRAFTNGPLGLTRGSVADSEYGNNYH